MAEEVRPIQEEVDEVAKEINEFIGKYKPLQKTLEFYNLGNEYIKMLQRIHGMYTKMGSDPEKTIHPKDGLIWLNTQTEKVYKIFRENIEEMVKRMGVDVSKLPL